MVVLHQRRAGHINAGTMQNVISARCFLALALVLCSCTTQWPSAVFVATDARSPGMMTMKRSVRFDDVVLPTHSNFLKSQYFRPGRREYVWCARNASICIDREKNPLGGSTCCWDKFCKDTTQDRNHCGGCGNACGYGLSCCGGRCVDANNNRNHCGSCDRQCTGGQRCSFGLCDYGSG